MNGLQSRFSGSTIRKAVALVVGSDWQRCEVESDAETDGTPRYRAWKGRNGVVVTVRPDLESDSVEATKSLFDDTDAGGCPGMHRLIDLLETYGEVRVPRLLFAGLTSRALPTPFLVTELLPGRPFSADRFPPTGTTAYAVGSHLGSVHVGTWQTEGFGAFGNPTRSGREWWRAFRAEYFEHTDSLKQMGRRDLATMALRALHEAEKAGNPEDFALINLNVAPEKFLGMNDGRVVGLADLDGYVWGPPELELAAALLTFADDPALRAGYASHCPWPSNYDQVRRAYQTFSLLSRRRRSSDWPENIAVLEAIHSTD